MGSASAPQTQTNQTLNTQTLLKIWPINNVLHNLSPSVPDPRQTTQYFWVGLLTFTLKTILGKKITFVFTEDQLKTVYMLMSRHFLLSFFSRSKN